MLGLGVHVIVQVATESGSHRIEGQHDGVNVLCGVTFSRFAHFFGIFPSISRGFRADEAESGRAAARAHDYLPFRAAVKRRRL